MATLEYSSDHGCKFVIHDHVTIVKLSIIRQMEKGKQKTLDSNTWKPSMEVHYTNKAILFKAWVHYHQKLKGF